MAASTWQRALTVVFIAVFLATSCTSLETVNIPAPESPPAPLAVKVGDTVVLTTRDNKEKRFKVHAVEADALVGKFERVAYADMATLNIEHIRKGPTIAVVTIAVFIVASIVAAIQVEEEFEGIIEGN